MTLSMQTALFAMLIGISASCAIDEIEPRVVRAARETAPMMGAGDKADDPAIWINPIDQAHSLILATNKDEGVYVYDFMGHERQAILVGPSNNIDLRSNLAVASNDGRNALSWFRIDPATARVEHVGDTPIERTEPYGVCMGVFSGRLNVVTTYKDGTIEMWRVTDDGLGTPSLSDRTVFSLRSQIEGCVIDDAAGKLFVGEEMVGLWVLDPQTGEINQIDSITSGGGLVGDVEGVSLYPIGNEDGYLVVSAQSRDRFVIYGRRPPYARRGVITIGASRGGEVDRVTHTDGLDVSSARLADFPSGVLIVQDDENFPPDGGQNFKIIDWRDVVEAID